jgi:hypothetical protein
MPNFMYNQGVFTMTGGGNLNWMSATLKARLLDASETPDRDDMDLTTKPYVALAADQPLTGLSSSRDPAADRVKFNSTGLLTFPAVAAGKTIGWLIVYDHNSSTLVDTPLCAFSLPATPTDGADVAVAFDPSTCVCYLQQ